MPGYPHHNETDCAICSETAYDEFRHCCVHESMAKNEVWFQRFPIDDLPRWDYDMDGASLTFSDKGVPRVVCEMQVVGSTKGNSWEWGWGNPNYPEACKLRMQEVLRFGKGRSWDRLSTLFLENDEFLGWECAAVSNHLLGGMGVYRCPTGDEDFIYLVILSTRLVDVPNAS